MIEENDEKNIVEMDGEKITVSDEDYKKLISDAQKFTNDLRYELEE